MPESDQRIGNIEVVIITGLSGAGKSQAIHCFEDIGYFCIDNLPPSLIPKLAELIALPGSRIRKVALVVDVRGGQFFEQVWQALRDLKAAQIEYRIVFLEAVDQTLVKRFKETRRRHPLAEGGEIVDGIKKERVLLASLREAADIVIDTTIIPASELREKIRSVFQTGPAGRGLFISVMSFGYKFGIPMDADLVIDVRFLPNPHYEQSLKHLTGENVRVREYVLDRPVTRSFLKKMESLLAFVMPHYVKEGKTHLTIAIGCTGGVHRSVVIASEVQQFLLDNGYHSILRHRDINRGLGSEREIDGEL